MSATIRTLRPLAAGLALAAALPALAQESEPQPPPPPPEALPWAPPPRQPPPPPRARAEQPVYRPDYVYPQYPPYPPPRARRPERAPDDGYAPPPRWARRPWWPHLELSVRAGVASPGGTAADGLALRDTVGDQAALGMELGLRATPNLFMGFLAEGGFGDAGRSSGVSCGSSACGGSSTTGRLGLVLRYHIAPSAVIDPWIAYGVAVSAAEVSGSTSAGSFRRTLSGVEWAKVSVGADLRLAGSTALGLYAEWTRGTFSHLEDRQDGVLVASGELAHTTDHSWFMIGPRLTF